MGYKLSNGCSGVYFNDSTKIICDPKNSFDYLYKQENERHDTCYTHTLDDYPGNLNKKVTLLQHFRSYLESKEYDDESEDDV